MGATGKLRMSGGGKAGPVVTDHGNLVIDAHFSDMSKPVELEKDLKLICGVVEVGLFTNICNAAYFGNLDGTSVKRLPPQ
jgi:ribose 5-phosphate isomerase A